MCIRLWLVCVCGCVCVCVCVCVHDTISLVAIPPPWSRAGAKMGGRWEIKMVCRRKERGPPCLNAPPPHMFDMNQLQKPAPVTEQKLVNSSDGDFWKLFLLLWNFLAAAEEEPTHSHRCFHRCQRLNRLKEGGKTAQTHWKATTTALGTFSVRRGTTASASVSIIQVRFSRHTHVKLINNTISQLGCFCPPPWVLVGPESELLVFPGNTKTMFPQIKAGALITFSCSWPSFLRPLHY